LLRDFGTDAATYLVEVIAKLVLGTVTLTASSTGTGTELVAGSTAPVAIVFSITARSRHITEAHINTFTFQEILDQQSAISSK